jgi:hypothetical protein
MANATVGNDITLGQAADYTAKQYYVVKLDTTAGRTTLATAGTDKIIGVISKTNTSTSVGAPINVHPVNASGTFKVVAGGNTAIGSLLTATTGGKAIATTTTGDYVFGICTEVGVDGQVVGYIPTHFKY